MAYSIIGSGQDKKRQALGTFDLLSKQEVRQNQVADNLEQQERAQNTQAAGTVAGMAVKHGIDKGVFSGDAAVNIYNQTAIDAAIEEGARKKGAELGAAVEKSFAEKMALDTGVQEVTKDAAGNLINQTAIDAGIKEGATQVATELGADALATGAAETAIAAEATGAVVAAEGAATAATLGPAGWIVGAGLLSYSLFG